MPRMFTIRQLRGVHEAILDRPLDKDTFRRHVEPFLTATGRLSTGTIGKPARLFTLAPTTRSSKRRS